MSHTAFKIIYDGPALETHEMNVNDLAPALLAMGGLMEEVGIALYGDKFKISVSVKGSFKTGCFGVDLIAMAPSLLQNAIDLFNHGSMTALINAAGIIGIIKTAGGSLIGFLRWAKNRKISRTEILQDGIVRVFIDHEHYDLEQSALAMLKNYKIRKAFESLIYKPLTIEGVESFAILGSDDPEAPVVHITREEACCFIAPEPSDEEINVQTTIVSLQIVSPSFAEGNKWKFHDGTSSFFAEILDQDFIDRVQAGDEVFAKNDILKVKLQLNQWLTAKGMRNDYTILDVLEHRAARRQIDLFDASSE